MRTELTTSLDVDRGRSGFPDDSAQGPHVVRRRFTNALLLGSSSIFF